MLPSVGDVGAGEETGDIVQPAGAAAADDQVLAPSPDLRAPACEVGVPLGFERVGRREGPVGATADLPDEHLSADLEVEPAGWPEIPGPVDVGVPAAFEVTGDDERELVEAAGGSGQVESVSNTKVPETGVVAAPTGMDGAAVAVRASAVAMPSLRSVIMSFPPDGCRGSEL